MQVIQLKKGVLTFLRQKLSAVSTCPSQTANKKYSSSGPTGLISFIPLLTAGSLMSMLSTSHQHIVEVSFFFYFSSELHLHKHAETGKGQRKCKSPRPLKVVWVGVLLRHTRCDCGNSSKITVGSNFLFSILLETRRYSKRAPQETLCSTSRQRKSHFRSLHPLRSVWVFNCCFVPPSACFGGDTVALFDTTTGRISRKACEGEGTRLTEKTS